MSSRITNLEEKDSFMLARLKDQTSVVNSTMNLLRQGLTYTKFKVDHLLSQTIEINRDGQIFHNELYQKRLFNEGIMQLSFLATKLQKIQACIVDNLVDTHHGRIIPVLLTPIQLQTEIR